MILLSAAALFVNIIFLGNALNLMFVYLWARRNPFIRMTFFGVINFQVQKMTQSLHGRFKIRPKNIFLLKNEVFDQKIYFFLKCFAQKNIFWPKKSFFGEKIIFAQKNIFWPKK